MAAVKLVRATSCPSTITATMVKVAMVKPMKRCGNCGGLGHNRRTCGVPEHYAAICHPTPTPKPAHKTTQRQCGHCGVMGHNRRTCPTLVTKKDMKVKEYTTTQLFARLPNYIVPEKVGRTPALEGLRTCRGLFRESKLSPFPPASERRAVLSLAALL